MYVSKKNLEVNVNNGFNGQGTHESGSEENK
jgi:hypothetical protein